jgi:predicted glycoside hydrolase/deacetylase ChbG (UPF0249 family)
MSWTYVLFLYIFILKEMRKLIINADDFGINKSITDAIIDCHKNGIITSTTLMSNMPFAEYAASKAKSFPGLSVGLHLNLTQGKPISNPSQIRNIVDSAGNLSNAFLQNKSKLNKSAQDQIFLELEAQLKFALNLGLKISHFDSHNRIQKIPAVLSAMIKLHKLYGVPAARTQKGLFWTAPDAPFHLKLKKNILNLGKLKKCYARHFDHSILRKHGLLTPDRLVSPYYLLPYPSDLKRQFIQCIKSLDDGIFELCLHPGYYDEKSTDSESYRKVREFDAQIACDDDIKKCISQCDVKLISFREV